MKTNPTKAARINVRLDIKTKQQLDREAARLSRKPSDLVRLLIDTFLRRSA